MIASHLIISGKGTVRYYSKDHFFQQEAHDQEINAVKWSSLERLVATGGADRKVKLWDISKGKTDSIFCMDWMP